MSKEKNNIFLVSKNELAENVDFIYDDRLREVFYNFTKSIRRSSGMNAYKVNWDEWKGTTYSKGSSPGTYISTKGMPSYQNYLDKVDEQRFEDILDDFITGLLSMTKKEKGEFLRFFDISLINERKKTEPKHIYNIINDKKSGDDIFESIKVSYLRNSNTIVLSSYNKESLDKMKLRLIDEGINVIGYRKIKNPNNNRDIHSIMYDNSKE